MKFPVANRLNVFTSILLVLILGIAAGCASGPPSYRQNIQSAITVSGNVSVRINDDGTVILTGWVEDLFSKQSVLRAARNNESVTQVIDRLYVRRN